MSYNGQIPVPLQAAPTAIPTALSPSQQAASILSSNGNPAAQRMMMVQALMGATGSGAAPASVPGPVGAGTPAPTPGMNA